HHVLSDTAGWVPLDVAGEPPPSRYYSRVEFDPLNRRVLLFGGQSRTVSGPLGDLWALELDRASPAVSVPGPDIVRIDWRTNLAGRRSGHARASRGRPGLEPADLTHHRRERVGPSRRHRRAARRRPRLS